MSAAPENLLYENYGYYVFKLDDKYYVRIDMGGMQSQLRDCYISEKEVEILKSKDEKVVYYALLKIQERQVKDNPPEVQNLEDFSPYDSNVKLSFFRKSVIFLVRGIEKIFTS
jgi:hypothetical protein